MSVNFLLFACHFNVLLGYESDEKKKCVSCDDDF